MADSDRWATEIRDLDGFPVKIRQENSDVFIIVASTAPRGRIRLGAVERNEFIQAYAEAERRAEAHKQPAAPDGRNAVERAARRLLGIPDCL